MTWQPDLLSGSCFFAPAPCPLPAAETRDWLSLSLADVRQLFMERGLDTDAPADDEELGRLLRLFAYALPEGIRVQHPGGPPATPVCVCAAQGHPGVAPRWAAPRLAVSQRPSTAPAATPAGCVLLACPCRVRHIGRASMTSATGCPLCSLAGAC